MTGDEAHGSKGREKKRVGSRQFSLSYLPLRASFIFAVCISPILHLIPPPPNPILHKVCFSFLLGITGVSREIENDAYAKCWGANKVHFGRCACGELREGRLGTRQLLSPPSALASGWFVLQKS